MNVVDFGAFGDGSTDDSNAIQSALDQNDGLVVIPQGTYKIGSTLRIRSNTRLVAHPFARLIFGDGAGLNAQSFLLTNQNHTGGDNTIHIEGGIWDGNNRHNTRGPDAPDSYTGVLLNFTKVKGFSLRGLTVRNSETYFIRLCEVSDFIVEDIRFEAPNLRPNQDGVHLGGYCDDGLIRNLLAVGPDTTNDDLVALNADDALHRAQNLGKKCGPIRNIRVEGLQADSCHSFVRLLSVHSPITDIRIENIVGGCHHTALNLDACRDCRVPLFDPSDPKYLDGVGDIRNVHIRDLNVHKSTLRDSHPLIDLRTNVNNFDVNNFQRNNQKDINPAAPTMVFSDCRSSQVIFEGLSHRQMEMIEESSGVVPENTQVINSSTKPIYQGQYLIEQGRVLRLSHNGFTALRINNAIKGA